MEKSIFTMCKEFRQSLGIFQAEVAKDTGYSLENISKFEHGHNNNMKIFLWYVSKGFLDSYYNEIGEE